MLNLLVVGVSDDPDERESTRLTDTIMVVSVNIEDQKVNILQIPRDTYVGEETSTHKINAIYAQNPDHLGLRWFGRPEPMIYDQFQVTIDHYVTIQMDGFRDMINAIGGVTMDVPVDMELKRHLRRGWHPNVKRRPSHCSGADPECVSQCRHRPGCRPRRSLCLLCWKR